jgi:hypothetical protein
VNRHLTEMFDGQYVEGVMNHSPQLKGELQPSLSLWEPAWRREFSNPYFLSNIEKICKHFELSRKVKAPGSSARLREMLNRWSGRAAKPGASLDRWMERVDEGQQRDSGFPNRPRPE